MISNQSTDPNVNAVCAKLVQRSEVGLRKYGVTTARPDLNLAAWLNHIQQELMDAAVYCEAAFGGVKEEGGWRIEDSNRSARAEVSAMSAEYRRQLESVGHQMMALSRHSPAEVLPLPNHAGYWWYKPAGLSDWRLVLAEDNELAQDPGYMVLSECSGAWIGRTFESFRNEPPSQWIPAHPPAA